MHTDIGICPNCGASGKIGASCEYCATIIASSNCENDESHSVISWSDFRLDGFTLVHKRVIGNVDFPEYYVIEGDRTGKQGLISKYGKVVIPCVYDYVIAYLDYNLCSVVKSGQTGVVDFNGKPVIPLQEGWTAENLFVVQYGYIVGFNAIYDLKGNLIIKLPSNLRICLLSDKYATTYPAGKGIYNIESGNLILSLEYKEEKMLDDDLFLISSFVEGATRYGIYKADTSEFQIPCECLSIQYQDAGIYVARIHTSQFGKYICLKTLTFSVSNNSIKIQKNDEQIFNDGSDKGGCMTIVIIATFLPILMYLLL